MENKIYNDFVTKSNTDSLIMLEGKIDDALNSIKPSAEFNKKMINQFSKNSKKINLLEFIFMKKYAFALMAFIIVASIIVIGVYAFNNSKFGLNPKSDIAGNKDDTSKTVKDNQEPEKKSEAPQLDYKNIDTSSWKTLRLKYDPEDAMDIKVPADWVLNTYNNGDTYTYAIVAPSGSAWGYDFSFPTSLVDCSGKTLVKINDSYSRYFDDQSNVGTNWYICELIGGKMQQHLGQSFSFYAKSDQDLATLDAMMASFTKIHQPGVSGNTTPTSVVGSYYSPMFDMTIRGKEGWKITPTKNDVSCGTFFFNNYVGSQPCTVNDKITIETIKITNSFDPNTFISIEPEYDSGKGYACIGEFKADSFNFEGNTHQYQLCVLSEGSKKYGGTDSFMLSSKAPFKKGTVSFVASDDAKLSEVKSILSQIQ